MNNFKDGETQDIFNSASSKAARKRLPTNLWKIAHRKLDMVFAATRLQDLRSPPANQLEKLIDDRKGQWSIRINDQYRICFVWTEAGAKSVEIADFH